MKIDKKTYIILLIILIVAIAFIVLRKIRNKMAQIKECEFFNTSEFDSPDLQGSGKNMQHSTLLMLCEARKIANVPFKINSGFRTVEHNKAVGGVVNSAHTRGYAADISTPKGKNQKLIVKALRQAGFKRFGIYTNFIHVDNDPIKKQFAYWGTAKHRFDPFTLV